MNAPGPIHALLYRSLATAPLTMDELRRIHAGACARNPELGVTGLLLFSGEAYVKGEGPGAFTQWLEGPEQAVRALYERIRADPRHTDVCTEAEGPARALCGVDGRLFPRWAMGLEFPEVLPATLPAFLTYYDERVGRGRRGSTTAPW